jgi:hypothetical protein
VKRAKEILEGMLERAVVRLRARLLALQAVLREPRTLAESAAPSWEDDDA